MKQLALPFNDAPAYAAEDFCPAPSNELALRWLDSPEGWAAGRLVLWGEPGCGKTHLLHIWAATRGVPVLDGAQTLPAAPGPLAVDDADLAPDEVALLHLLNTAAEAGQPVLLAARQPPARQTYRLADLASRLRASLAVEIGPPDEALLAALLARLEAERQMQLAPPVRNLLLNRLPRAPWALREAMARLDRAALDRGARVTLGVAAALLADLEQYGSKSHRKAID